MKCTAACYYCCKFMLLDLAKCWLLGPARCPVSSVRAYRVDSNLAKVQLNINSKALVAHIDRAV